MKNPARSFRIHCQVDPSIGKPEAAYFSLRDDAKSSETVEAVPGVLFLDRDAVGELVGIEVLGPVTRKQMSDAIEDVVAFRFVLSCIPTSFLKEKA